MHQKSNTQLQRQGCTGSSSVVRRTTAYLYHLIF
nr:MAG TPA: hypothetical protein [Caudoviricetes sp.]